MHQEVIKKQMVEGVDFGWELMDREKNPDEIIVSPSGLMLFMKSPKHYAWRYIKKKGYKQTQAQADGKAIHMAILEPERFERSYVHLDKKDYPNALAGMAEFRAHIEKLNEEKSLKIKKSGTLAELAELIKAVDPDVEFWDDIVKKVTEGKTLLDDADKEQIAGIKESLAENEDLSFLINHSKGRTEQKLWVRHKRTGVILHGVLDWFAENFGNRPVYADVKTTRCAEMDEFSRDIWNNKTFIQMAMYEYMLQEVFGVDPLAMFIAIEKTGPYCIEGYPADIGMMSVGRTMMEQKLDDLVKCYKENNWPGYNKGRLVQIGLPRWADAKLDQIAERELNEAQHG